MGETEPRRSIGQGGAGKRPDFNSRGLHVAFWPAQKPLVKLGAWLRLQQPRATPRLFWPIVLWGLAFIGLNVLDAMITNKAFDLYPAKEANPLIAPLAGTSALYFKGVFCLMLIGVEYCLLQKSKLSFKNILPWIPSMTFKQFLIAGCVLLAGVCTWNVLHIGGHLG